MANDPNPALRAEIEAAIAVVDPQIRGLHDLMDTPTSAALNDTFTTTVQARERRRALLQSVITGLDSAVTALANLEADGYPNLPDVIINTAESTELTGERTDLEAAIAIFSTGAVALDLNDKEVEPQPVPAPPGP